MQDLLTNRSMHLKAYQAPKYCTAVYNNQKQMESYYSRAVTLPLAQCSQCKQMTYYFLIIGHCSTLKDDCVAVWKKLCQIKFTRCIGIPAVSLDKGHQGYSWTEDEQGTSTVSTKAYLLILILPSLLGVASSLLEIY